MITIGSVPVPVVGVVDVVAMLYRLVSAPGSMVMAVLGVRQVRERMLIVVAFVRRMGVSFVHVVDVSLALGPCVSATGPVHVVVIMDMMLGGSHPSLPFLVTRAVRSGDRQGPGMAFIRLPVVALEDWPPG